MQAPPIPCNWLPVTRAVNYVSMLSNLNSSILQYGHAVAVPNFAKQGCAYEGFDLEVIILGIVHDAAVEGFAGPFCRTGE